MKMLEVVREYEATLIDMMANSEGKSDESKLRNIKVAAYYLMELAKRWGDGRTMPMEKAIKKSDVATRAWLRKNVDRELEKSLRQGKGLIELLNQTDGESQASASAEPPSEEPFSPPDEPDTSASPPTAPPPASREEPPTHPRPAKPVQATPASPSPGASGVPVAGFPLPLPAAPSTSAPASTSSSTSAVGHPLPKPPGGTGPSDAKEPPSKPPATRSSPE